MLVIVAGMGGGTGSGAASVIARIAKEMGIFTVSVVSKPFFFEGSARMQLAEACINELIPQVESLIVIPNETFLIGVNENTGVDECFFAVDECFKNTVGSITDIRRPPSFSSREL